MSPLIMINPYMYRGDLLVTLNKSAERSHSRFALAIFCVLVRNCFLLPVMPTRVASGKSKSTRVGLHTGIPRLRMPMDGIPF
jgi:hypothetical protein